MPLRGACPAAGKTIHRLRHGFRSDPQRRRVTPTIEDFGKIAGSHGTQANCLTGNARRRRRELGRFGLDGYRGEIFANDRGVDVSANGKRKNSTRCSALKTTHIQFARAYLVGEIHADFLDGDEDNISTGRNAHTGNRTPDRNCKIGASAAVKYVFEQWLAYNGEEQENKDQEDSRFRYNRPTTRTPCANKSGNDKLIKSIIDDAYIEPESAGPLLEIIKTNVEFQAFQELVDEIRDRPVQMSPRS